MTEGDEDKDKDSQEKSSKKSQELPYGLNNSFLEIMPLFHCKLCSSFVVLFSCLVFMLLMSSKYFVREE